LCDAVDRCDLVWISGGSSNWFIQTNVTADGIDALQSGRIATNQHTWVETTVAGPAQVGFDWRVSSRTNAHYLRFQVDGVSQASISGTSNWHRRVFAIPAGVHTLRWVFTNSATGPQGSNAAWVDRVAIDYLLATPTTTWYPAGPVGGPFVPDTREYVLTNSGTTAIQWTLQPDVPWISVQPENGELEPGASAVVECRLNDTAAALPPGIRPGSVTFSNQTTGGTFQRLVSLNVQDYLVVSGTTIYYQGYIGGPYLPPSQTVFLSNRGPAAVSWTVTRSTNWATLMPMAGSLEPGATQAVEIVINTNANLLSTGWNYLQLVFSNATTQLSQNQYLYLYLEDPLAIVADGAAPGGPVGGPFTPATTVFTVTNRGTNAQTWSVATPAPWLTLNQAGGMLAGQAATQVLATVNAAAGSLPLGVHVAAVTFSNLTTRTTFLQSVLLSAGVFFCDALEACGSAWSFADDTPWLYQTNIARDGIDAAASGLVRDSQASGMQTVVTGPGSLSFWWKVSSEDSYDYLEFWINGVRTNRLSGEVDWQQPNYTLGPGRHTLQWRYAKDSSVSNGSDRGWVDLVAWSPDRTAKGVPVGWYQRFGLAPDNGETWDALDSRASAAGPPNWIQYATGLSPVDPDDLFRIVDIRPSSGGGVQVAWWGGTNGPPVPYVVESAPDLELGPWEPAGTHPRAAGLHVWSNAVPEGAARYFRIQAPMEP
jgi:hypothetical protein